MEKAYQLPQALARVGRVEEPVQLGHRGAEATRKLGSAEPGPLRPPPRLHGQLVNQARQLGCWLYSRAHTRNSAGRQVPGCSGSAFRVAGRRPSAEEVEGSRRF